MLLGMWDLSSLTRDRTHVPCIARQILNLWTIKEVPKKNVLNKKIILDPPAQSWTASRSSSATPTPTHTHSCVCARAHTHTHKKDSLLLSILRWLDGLGLHTSPDQDFGQCCVRRGQGWQVPS